MDDSMVNNLRNELLNFVSNQINKETFVGISRLIREFTNCNMCSLWRINNNSTHEKNEYKSASLLVRTLKRGLKHSEDFTHELNDSLIQCVLQQIKKTSSSYYLCNIENCDKCDNKPCYKIRARESLRGLNLQYFLSIPIYEQNSESETTALLILAFTDEPKTNNFEEMSSIISKVMSSCFYRNMVYRRQNITQRLVENYYDKGTKKHLRDIFYPILHSILKEEYWPYESASAFIWDSYKNNYKLLSTTGIEEYNNVIDYEEVTYKIGEGKTGEVANKKRAKIYDKSSIVAEGKYIEKTANGRKTMMIIPIFRPSKRDEVIGILRFVNKQNLVSKEFTDYFNDADIEVMSYVADYLALIIDYFLGEEERNNFISKLSHEFISPANSIRATADRLLKNNTPSFIERNFVSYLEDVRVLAELQLQQANTNLYVVKTRVNTPCSQKYKVERHFLKDIILQGKKTVIPFARDEGLRFDNITIPVDASLLPDWNLYIDKGAFSTVFHNLIINAIKYRIPNANANFAVKIRGHEFAKWLVVHVSDYGLGIKPTDKDKIFLMGYRGENVTRSNNAGFGIGLSVVKQIITDFEGEISVVNFQNPTTFEIKLPRILFYDKYTKEQKWNSLK